MNDRSNIGTAVTSEVGARRRHRRLRELALAGTALTGLALAAPSPAEAATFTVTSTADDGSAGTLRWAIRQANQTVGVDGIDFGIGGTGTIGLASGLPPIEASVAIDGAGGVTINGGGNHRAFTVLSGTVDIRNLGIANAAATGGAGGDTAIGGGGGGGGLGAGGALFVNSGATVTIANVGFTDNKAVGGTGGAGGAIGTGYGGSTYGGGGGGGGFGGKGGSAGEYAGGGGDGGGLWAQSYGTFNPLGGGATAIATGSEDVTAAGGGAIVGIDRRIAPGLTVGVAAGHDRIRLGLDGLDQEGEIASHRVAVYGGRQAGGLRLAANAGYAYHRNRTEREIGFAAIERTAAAAYDGHELSLAGEAGYRLELGEVAGGALSAEPVAGLAYTRLSEAGYEESGAGAVDLTVDGRTTTSLRSTVGLRLGLDATARVRPRASLAWGHEFGPTERQAQARFAGGGGGFTLEGEEAPRDLALATIGIEADLAPGTALTLGADGALGQDRTQGALKAAIKLAW